MTGDLSWTFSPGGLPSLVISHDGEPVFGSIVLTSCSTLTEMLFTVSFSVSFFISDKDLPFLSLSYF